MEYLQLGNSERIWYHDIGEKYSAFLKYTMLTVFLTQNIKDIYSNHHSEQYFDTLSTDRFVKISLQLMMQDNWREIFSKQSVYKCR